MEGVSRIVNIVLPVLAALGLGWFSRVKGILSRAQVEGLKRFIVTFSLPAVLFSAFYGMDYDLRVPVVAACVFLLCGAAMLAGTALSRRGMHPLTPFLVSGFEAGMMGYSLYALLFGAEHLSAMAMAAVGGDVFVFTWYSIRLKGGYGMARRDVLRETFASPIFLAILAGILLGATGAAKALSQTAAGGAIDAVAGFLSGPTACGILFVVGYSIDVSGEGLREGLKTALARLVICGVLGAALILALRALVGLNAHETWALALLLILPAPYVLPVFLKDPAEERHASNCLSTYTLLSVAMFCVLAAVAG